MRSHSAGQVVSRRFRVRGATVTLDDKRTDYTWRADRVDIAIERASKGIRGDLALAVPLE